MKSFTVAFVITRSDVIGGAQVHVRDLARRLTQDGHRAVVLVGGNGPLTMDLTRAGVEWHSIASLVQPVSPAKDIGALIQLLRALRRIKPDIVSTHTAKAGLVGRLASRLLGIPVLFTAHGWSINPDRFDSLKGWAFRMLEVLAGRMSTRIINVCEHERALALQFGVAREDTLCTIHNGMPDIPSSLMSDASQSPPRMVMVARMEDQKDHDTLLYALPDLMSLDWTLTLIGEGPRMPVVRQLIQTLGLSSRVSLAGDCEWSVAKQLSRSQVFVLISHWEAFPRSILEAMRAGLPIVATDISGVKESVANGINGYLIPKRDHATLGTCLRALLSDPELRARMGRASRSRYESSFTFEKMYLKTAAVYRDVLLRETDRADSTSSSGPKNARPRPAKPPEAQPNQTLTS